MHLSKQIHFKLTDGRLARKRRQKMLFFLAPEHEIINYSLKAKKKVMLKKKKKKKKQQQLQNKLVLLILTVSGKFSVMAINFLWLK